VAIGNRIKGTGVNDCIHRAIMAHTGIFVQS
jgi:hypothetical protein